MLTRAEKTELALVVAATGVLILCRERLPVSLELGSALAIGALALLVQGLFRDLWLLSRQRRAGPKSEQHEEARCMCLESTVGLAGVVSGVVLTAAALPVVVKTGGWVWPVAGVIIWGAGFMIKDVVIQWSPWKLRRIKDHGSIWVRWR